MANDNTAAANASNYLRAVFHTFICASRGDCPLGARCPKVRDILQLAVGDRNAGEHADAVPAAEPVRKLLLHWLECPVGAETQEPCVVCADVYSQLLAPQHPAQQQEHNGDVSAHGSSSVPFSSGLHRSNSSGALGEGGHTIRSLAAMLQDVKVQGAACSVLSCEESPLPEAGGSSGSVVNSDPGTGSPHSEACVWLIHALLSKAEVSRAPYCRLQSG